MAPNNFLLHHIPSSPHAQELHDPSPSHPKNDEEAANELNGYLDNLIYTMQTYQMEYDIENVRKLHIMIFILEIWCYLGTGLENPFLRLHIQNWF
ncbi:hypothetical protein P8452_42331 [Trifolium repens]|nr:hypothetical protein P8452_42331 [Trifolium repens]